MGGPTVTATRILRGQTMGQTGEETVLEFEKFPNVGYSKTYSQDRQTTDSAATATALLCGEKTNYRLIGLNDQARDGQCASQHGNEITCAFEWFRADGRSLGLVTTARVTHATPAAAYAKSASRNWEVDGDMVGVTGGCKDIASQLIYNNSDIKVILGGGRQFFLGKDDYDPELNDGNSGKQRQDGVNLIQVWQKDKEMKNANARYAWNNEQFDAIDPATTDYILGLFEASHMQYDLDRNKGPKGEPSLAALTQKAIRVLQKNQDGFFLLVEGGRIDHAHHENNAKRALYDGLAFEDAVKIATNMTDENDTLIIVTADHAHVFNIAGYPTRGNNIFGIVDNDEDENGPHFTTLLYGNGPGYRAGAQTDVHATDTTDNDYLQSAAAPRFEDSHGGQDVGIYARGPMAHLIHGVHEQHYIAHVMSYAACVADNRNRCKGIVTTTPTTSGAGNNDVSKIYLFTATFVACYFLCY
ncbi:alkaline phosphatase, tissue-nonspecific isozyme-like [Ylistrum balloti]|uniref:alkaline phosphatase, tissue-nonspecific isozyme-like n=1 Tax=Ylistrum balloti TaxID=509963 RepID=UPI0029057F44|nr:alkaline phosphatase, tissue-nonspecific isozyme-like [Ylistrum balloti]